MDGAARYDRVNLVSDPLHGYVEVTKGRRGVAGETDLLDTPWMQRLRRIRQLQSAWWVFPTAEHSRFPHLIGAMHLASRFAHRLDQSLRDTFPDAPSPACVEETLRIAGLLHDVGHGPFGHFCDVEFLRPRYDIDHEVISRHLVLGELAPLIADLRESPSGPFAPGEAIDPRWVAWVMADPELPGYAPPPWLRACKPVLCGPATVDNLDYVPRDAYMCGVGVGPVDIDRIIHYSFVHGDTVVLHAHAAGALEMFLTTRLYMYLQVYMHRTVRRFDLSMREVFAETLDQLLPASPLEEPGPYARLTDWSMIEAVEAWHRSPGDPAQRRLGEAWHRILNRELPWVPVFETQLRRDEHSTTLRDDIIAALPAARRGVSFEVDVATARIAPHNPMADDGMVGIYDPMSGAVEHSRTAALVARLPQFNQVLRIFTNDPSAADALYAAARAVVGPPQTTPMSGVAGRSW